MLGRSARYVDENRHLVPHYTDHPGLSGKLNVTAWFRRYWTFGVGPGSHVLVTGAIDLVRDIAEQQAGTSLQVVTS